MVYFDEPDAEFSVDDSKVELTYEAFASIVRDAAVPRYRIPFVRIYRDLNRGSFDEGALARTLLRRKNGALGIRLQKVRCLADRVRADEPGRDRVAC
jgi:hypothetical protein